MGREDFTLDNLLCAVDSWNSYSGCFNDVASTTRDSRCITIPIACDDKPVPFRVTAIWELRHGSYIPRAMFRLQMHGVAMNFRDIRDVALHIDSATKRMENTP